MYGGARQGMDQQAPSRWDIERPTPGSTPPPGWAAAVQNPMGWPPPDGGMNKPLPAQWPGATAPIQPPMDKGTAPASGMNFDPSSGQWMYAEGDPRASQQTHRPISSMNGGGFQSGPMGFGGTAVGPPGAGGPMPPWLQSIGALIAQRRGMMGNDPWMSGMSRGSSDPGGMAMGASGQGQSMIGPGVGEFGANVMGTGAPPAAAVPPKPTAPVAATPPPTPQVKPQRMAQGRPVSERDGVTGVTGRGGNFQKLGKSAMRRLK